MLPLQSPPHQEHQQPPPARVWMDTCCFCCWCFSLQTGCAVIACLGLVIGIGYLYYGLTVLGFFGFKPTFHLLSLFDKLTLFYGVWNLVTGLSLLYGVDKRKTLPLKFWLYSHYVEMGLIVGVAVYFLTLIPDIWAPAWVSATIIIFFFIVVLAFVVYIIAVVDNFRREITNDVQRLCENI